MTVKDRPSLTHQALWSLHNNTKGDWSLVLVNDGSDQPTQDILKMFAAAYPSKVCLIHVGPDRYESGVIGKLKNLGVDVSINAFGQNEWLYLSDNDVFFTEGWDKLLISTANTFYPLGFRLFGGQNHPFHEPVGNLQFRGFHEYLAVAGTSWLMKFATWHIFGPLDGNAKGVQQSEDTAFCNRIRTQGYKVGAMNPPAVLDTGITQTDGQPSVGADVKRRVLGVKFL